MKITVHVHTPAIQKTFHNLQITTKQHDDMMQATREISELGYASGPGERLRLKKTITDLLDLLDIHLSVPKDLLLPETQTFKFEFELGTLVLEQETCPSIMAINSENDSKYEHIPYELTSYMEVSHHGGLTTKKTILLATNQFLKVKE